MKKNLWLTYITIALLSLKFTFAAKPEEETLSLKPSYEELISHPYTDHVPAFKTLFDLFPNPTLIEFGVGRGTYYLLQRCKFVFSLELLGIMPTETYNEEFYAWYKACVEEYKNFPNWNHDVYFATDDLSDANLVSLQVHPYRTSYPHLYLDEIRYICDKYAAPGKYDMAFVDSGIHNRGEIVNELFGRVKIIVAHDTGYSRHHYGWDKIRCPEDYTRVTYKRGVNTSFWIHNSLKELSDKLRSLDTFE